jgi:trehalose 6-phosphate phosphatase
MLPVVDAPLFFLDYDGTLAPIVDDPDAAVPHPDIPAILQALDDAYPVWIVTGRDLAQLADLLDLPLQAIGLHGAQSGVIGGRTEQLMSEEAADAIARLRASLPSIDGVRVEDKQQAFAVHYRQAVDPDDARKRLQSWADTMPEMLDAIWGKKVVELRPDGLSKGTAVRRIAADHPDRTPVYLGDDVTDEDAFTALDDLERDAVTVKVGEGETVAHHRLDGPDEVARYLRQYV